MDFRDLHLLLRCGRDYCHSRIRQKGLTDTEHLICSYVYIHPLCSQDEAAKALGLDKTTLGKALDVLSARGALLRTPDQSDRRKKQLSLTDEGKNLLSDIFDINEQWLSSVLSVLSPEEKDRFMGYMERIVTSAKNLSEQSKESKQ